MGATVVAPRGPDGGRPAPAPSCSGPARVAMRCRLGWGWGRAGPRGGRCPPLLGYPGFAAAPPPRRALATGESMSDFGLRRGGSATVAWPARRRS
eukprot:4423136-Alexandrium_andersonii.AAC.1